jgi:CubicO group peptidase (beta-lactamase class C family)
MASLLLSRTSRRVRQELCAAVMLVPILIGCGSAGAAGDTRVGVALVPDAQRGVYYPEPGDRWARRRPSEVAMDSTKLASAVAFARAHEIKWVSDMTEQIHRNTAREPYPDIVGPVKDRGAQNGIVVRHGYIVAEWGETGRVDMTFSVAKSYLSTVAGLSFDRGMIQDMNDAVSKSVHDGGYDSPHNAAITWHQTFNQTSEWEGTLWNKPDVADRRAGYTRTLNAPGTFWEYNDVRVNRAALSLLRLWKKPLPDVLRDEIMRPIGASDTWQWHGYNDAFADVDGKRMPSVSGGGHWGAGLWATTRDHARFGYLMLRKGRWDDRQLVSRKWVAMATTPTPIHPVYGYMWWLNTDRKQYPAATAKSFFALGSGGNVIWIVPEYDMVVVARWLDNPSINEFMQRVLSSVTDE